METKIYYLTSDLDNEIPVYVGKTIKTNLKDRLSQHIYEAKTRALKNKKDAWLRKRLRQKANIKICLIETTNKDWQEREKYWILEYSKLYNLKNHTLGGEGAPGNTHSEETRKKISTKLKNRKLSQEHIENIRKCRIGWNFSEETKDKIAKAHKGKKLSKETKNKISISKKGEISKRRIKINQYDKEKNFIKTWDSIQEAAEKLNICRPNIIKVLKKQRPLAGGYYFEY